MRDSRPVLHGAITLEVLDRLHAARVTIDGVLLGGWALDAKVLVDVARLVMRAAAWQHYAESQAA